MLDARRVSMLTQALPKRTAGALTQGFSLVALSPYLRHICAFIMLQYTTSSFFYFTKTQVPEESSLKTPNYRASRITSLRLT